MSVEPITFVMMASSIIGGVTSLAGGIEASRDKKRQAEEAEVSAIQDDVNRRREFLSLVSSNVADAGSRGIDPNSRGSFFAINREQEKLLKEDLSNIAFMGRSRAKSLRRQGRGALLKGVGGFVSGVAGAASTGDKAGLFDSNSNTSIAKAALAKRGISGRGRFSGGSLGNI